MARATTAKQGGFFGGQCLPRLGSVHSNHHRDIPFLPGIAEQKATGMGATASGLAEGHVTFGLMLALLVPVGNNCLAESC